MPFISIPPSVWRFFQSSKAPVQAKDAGTGQFNVLGERLPVQHPLSQAQALHKADTTLAQAPGQDHSQLYPPRQKPRGFDTTEALQGPECIFLPQPSLKLPTPSGLGKRRRHHDRNSCGLNVILKPAVLVSQLPFKDYTEWEREEHRLDIMVEQQRTRTRAYANSHSEDQNRTPAQAAEDQLRAQLKTPRQGRIPLAELNTSMDATKHLEELPPLYSIKEKVVLRNLRREIARFPQIRADVLAVRPEMETHPLYCTSEHLKKLGIDPFWDLPEESDNAAPTPAASARAPTRIPRPLPLRAPEPVREHERSTVAAWGLEEQSKWKAQENEDFHLNPAKRMASGVLGNNFSRLDLKEEQESANPPLSMSWGVRRGPKSPKIDKPVTSLDQELIDEDFESINGDLDQTGERANSVVSISFESIRDSKFVEDDEAIDKLDENAGDVEPINTDSVFVKIDLESTNGDVKQESSSEDGQDMEFTSGDSAFINGDLNPRKVDKNFVDVDLDSSNRDSEQEMAIMTLKTRLQTHSR
ncbi:hypothetical protein MMC30_005414 [Trapelia coarctata]|nr:hypothetical protein [Trapelia coarctata]